MKTLEEAARIKESVEHEWIKLPGVTGIDVGYAAPAGAGESEPVIRVYVEDRQKALESSAIPSQVQNVRVVVIERRFRLH